MIDGADRLPPFHSPDSDGSSDSAHDSSEGGGAERPSTIGGRHIGATIGLLAMVSLIAFEALAIATAMPVAADRLGGVREYGLAFSLFLTASLFGSVSAGIWADRVGLRGPTLVGIALFGIGLAVSGLASSFPMLLAGRAVSGLGAGQVSVIIYLLIAAIYSEESQPRMFSAVSAAWVVPSLVGPLLAGLLTTQVSWRAVFLVVLPLLIGVIPLIRPYLGRPGRPAVRTHTDGARRLLRGAALAVGASLLQVGLVGMSTTTGRALAAAGAVCVLVTVPGLLPPGMLRIGRGLPALVSARMLYTATFFGAEAFLPLMLVQHRGVSPGQAGLTLTVGAVGWSLGAWWQGRPGLGRSWSRLPWVGGAFLGLGVVALSLGALPDLPTPIVAPLWIVAGLGMGLAMSSTSVLLIRLSWIAERGRNAASVQIGDSLGGVLGIGAAGAVFAALHDSTTEASAVYVIIWIGLGLIGLLSAPVAGRIGRT